MWFLVLQCYVMLCYVMRMTNVYCDVMCTMGVRIQMRVLASIKLKYLTVIELFRTLTTTLHYYLQPCDPIVHSLPLPLLTTLLPVQFYQLTLFSTRVPFFFFLFLFFFFLHAISTLFPSTTDSSHTSLHLIIFLLCFYIHLKGTLTQNKMTAIRAFCPGMEDEVLLISDGGHIDDKGKMVTWLVDNIPSFFIYFHLIKMDAHSLFLFLFLFLSSFSSVPSNPSLPWMVSPHHFYYSLLITALGPDTEVDKKKSFKTPTLSSKVGSSQRKEGLAINLYVTL